jgi:hypothetical protein
MEFKYEGSHFEMYIDAGKIYPASLKPSIHGDYNEEFLEILIGFLHRYSENYEDSDLLKRMMNKNDLIISCDPYCIKKLDDKIYLWYTYSKSRRILLNSDIFYSILLEFLVDLDKHYELLKFIAPITGGEYRERVPSLSYPLLNPNDW